MHLVHLMHLVHMVHKLHTMPHNAYNACILHIVHIIHMMDRMHTMHITLAMTLQYHTLRQKHSTIQPCKYIIHRNTTQFLHIRPPDFNLIMPCLWLGRARRDWATHCVRRGACLLLTQRGTAHLQLKEPPHRPRHKSVLLIRTLAEILFRSDRKLWKTIYILKSYIACLKSLPWRRTITIIYKCTPVEEPKAALRDAVAAMDLEHSAAEAQISSQELLHLWPLVTWRGGRCLKRHWFWTYGLQ